MFSIIGYFTVVCSGATFGDKMKRIFLTMALGLIIAGCSLDKGTIDAACTPPFIVWIYDHGRRTSTVTITNNSQLSSEVQDWLKTNPNEWRTSFITFAPSVEIKNDNMSLNFMRELAVLNVKDPNTGKWRQLIKTIDLSTLEFAKEIREKAKPIDARGGVPTTHDP